MPAEPYNWNVVLIGAWNIAILSPDGIRKRLFQLPEGTPVEVQVAIDNLTPNRVLHDGLKVIPSTRYLEIELATFDDATLQRAVDLAGRALTGLPETPVTAAGINLRYGCKPFPDEMLDLLRAPIDDALSDAGHTISARVTTRSVELAPGVINVEISEDTASSGTLEFNFHRTSSSTSDLQTWLNRWPEFVAAARGLRTALNIPQ